MSDRNTHSTGPDPDSKAALERAAMQDAQMQDVHAQLMREKDEPHEGFSPIPIFLLFAFAALCFWGGVYFVENSGDFRWDAYDPNFDAGAEVVVVEIPLAERGAKIYRNQCAQCHQPTGAGVPGVYPPLVASSWVTGSEERLARILINGLNGPIEVAGNTYNGNMPAFGPNGLNLKSRDIAAVLTFIRQEWGNAASEIPIESMDAFLADYAGRAAPWTAEELLAEFPME
ncbi:MAG: cytochrome c [Verrucomicrobiota bacterium]